MQIDINDVHQFNLALSVDQIKCLRMAILQRIPTEAPTLRDQFAMAALQGCLAYSYVNPMSGNYHENANPEQVAGMAYVYADAMLGARK